MSSTLLLLLVALLLLLVAAGVLVTWLSRRSGAADQSRTVSSVAATGDSMAPAVTDQAGAVPASAVAGRETVATSADATSDAEPADGDPVDGEAPDGDPADGVRAAADDHESGETAAAATDPGLDANAAADDEPIHEDGFWDDDETDGEAAGGPDGDKSATLSSDPISAQRSPLDETDLDSTPLFRSIRDERFGAPAQGGEAERSWSQERRDWDEQAHLTEEPTGPPVAQEPVVEEPVDQEPVVQEPVTDEPAGEDAVMEETGTREPVMEPVVMKEEAVEKEAVEKEATEQPVEAEPVSDPAVRRISELHEVVDGGFGIGSAATISDGAQPLGHPIKANRDTRTYQDLHSLWYDETDPDVWFLDVGFAERAGFHRAE